VAEARWLRARFAPGELTSMMDVSDGLGIDAGRVGVASGVRVVIDVRALPLHAGVRDWRQAMGEGEDYELVFTLSPGAAARLPASCPETGVAFTRVGEVEGVAGEGARVGETSDGAEPGSCVVLPDGTRVDTTALGWDHA
jgi:thiamine-monophosphate kinase